MLSKPLIHIREGSVFIDGNITNRNNSEKLHELSEVLELSSIKGVLRWVNYPSFGFLYCDLNLEKQKELYFERKEDVIEMRMVLEGTCVTNSATNSRITLMDRGHDLNFYGANKKCTNYQVLSKHLKLLVISVEKSYLQESKEETNELLRSFCSNISQMKSTSLQERSFTINKKMNDAIHQVLNHNKKGAIKQIYLQSRILELLRLQLEQSYSSEHLYLKYGLKDDTVKRIHLCRDFLHENLDKSNITLSFLARHCGTNEYTLKSGFKSIFNDTVFGYWKRVKMQKAQKLLLKSTTPIVEIAESIGYKNHRHFSTAFKKEFGLSPKDYRKQN
ncbi:MAG: AraC family transcriptional regulator [Bacteroidota bacterium]